MAALLFWLLVWQVAAMQVDSILFLPTPLQVLQRLASLTVTAAFWQTALFSLCRVALGLLLGT